jgi:hypothetical protein
MGVDEVEIVHGMRWDAMACLDGRQDCMDWIHTLVRCHGRDWIYWSDRFQNVRYPFQRVYGISKCYVRIVHEYGSNMCGSWGSLSYSSNLNNTKNRQCRFTSLQLRILSFAPHNYHIISKTIRIIDKWAIWSTREEMLLHWPSDLKTMRNPITPNQP